MKKLLLASAIAVVCSPALAEEVNEIRDADSNAHVRVSNIAGTVTVRGWSRESVEVTGTLGRNVEELYFESDGGKVLIKVKVPRRGGRGIDSDLTINVPHGVSLDIGTVSADISVADVVGEQDLQTVSGDIDTEFSGDDVSVESVSGDIEIDGDNSVGEVAAGSVSGDLVLSRVSGEVEAGSVSGNVIVNEGTFDEAEVGTVNGKIVIRGVLAESGDLAVESVNGSVDIELDGDVSASVDIETLNGRIRNCFGPEPERASRYGPGWELSFTEGDGDGRIRIETVNGGVALCKD